MAITAKQAKRVQDILDKLNDLLDKRFLQARRVNPKVGAVEADMRWHQLETTRQILSETKGFGPVKLMVGDIFASADEEKKGDLMSATNQVSLLNEIVPADEESGEGGRRSGQLEINDVKSFYRALDPSLEKILTLLQTWIWWDIRDAAELYRFDMQGQRLASLRQREPDGPMMEYYRQEMAVKPGVDITKGQIIHFELVRTREVIQSFEKRRSQDRGYQMIVVSEEIEGSAEADSLCVKVARRLMAIDKIRKQEGALDDAVRQYYANLTNTAPDAVTPQSIVDYESAQAGKERELLAKALDSGGSLGESADYKFLKLEEMKSRFAALCASLGVNADQISKEASHSLHTTDLEEKKKEKEGVEDAPMLF